ncbi:putative RDD domain containing protein [Candidatus Competibacter denitrificans Run_A_D11]|uniref:RDD domain containing protein n=1 Tax=Candidatus Competibacter denitrificans Run_A_D11 TaxID=1400863 RepID=W6M0Q5_9GAMM|nr:RDD family protein [Candidatus Competibacter denitrificans]CDI00936.1 putative RDD domain containing protein [Candidatus Competibacter denitrificans Run_A_D11]HAS85842.1 RDD family protein [Candidatus Competibacteraceae bacterium]HRC70039.1 RDD family protein [Candidatus Competibacter denitrificans]
MPGPDVTLDPANPPASAADVPPALPLPRARLPRRLAAILYDSLLLAGVLLVASALALAIAVAVWGGETVTLHDPLRSNPFFSMYLLLVCFLFYGGFWVHGGQTLGMRAWRIQVRRYDGNGIGWWQALARFLVGGLWLAPLLYLHRALGATVLSLSAGLLSLIMIQALRLPDQVSSTELLMLPKRTSRSSQAIQGQETGTQKQ